MDKSYGPIVPTLHVASMPSSIEFYRDVLGFALKWNWSEKGGFEGASEPEFACLECGEAVLFLSAHGGGSASSLFIEMPFIEDVDALAAAIEGLAVIDSPPETMPWGSREFVIKDSDGHALRFSCPSNRVKRNPNG